MLIKMKSTSVEKVQNYEFCIGNIEGGYVNRFLKAQANIFDTKIMFFHKDGKHLHRKSFDNENSFVLTFNEVLRF